MTTPLEIKYELQEKDKPLKKCTIARQDMCFYCFDILKRYLMGMKRPKAPVFNTGNHPVFVTWKIKRGRDYHLRGCVGTFSPVDLQSGLYTYALRSALNDSRFPPILFKELKRLNVCVSILLQFETGENYKDWSIGTHGIIIEFEDKDGVQKSATYLPEVAAEQRWNTTQTVDHLLRKSGYRGPIDQEIRNRLKLTRYRTEKIETSYSDYLRKQKSGGIKQLKAQVEN